MVAYPNQSTIDPILAKAVQDQKNRPSLQFSTVGTDFVTQNDNGRPVAVTRVTGAYFSALIFKTPLHIDFDGAPKSFAPPASATITGRQGGMIEKSIKNATNKKDPDPVFHDDNKLNKFTWTGVQSAPAGSKMIDERPFLKDINGNFPKFRPGKDFYLPQTAMATADGLAVNALTVPYGVLSTSLMVRGRVHKGDVGLAIRMSTGASSVGFIYADTVGGKSVGEFSAKLVSDLFGGPVTNPVTSDEVVSIIVFPGTSDDDAVAEPELIPSLLTNALVNLGMFENAEELIDRVANPQFGEPLFAGRVFLPQKGLRMNLLRNLDAILRDQNSIARANLRAALRRWGSSQLAI